MLSIQYAGFDFKEFSGKLSSISLKQLGFRTLGCIVQMDFIINNMETILSSCSFQNLTRAGLYHKITFIFLSSRQ